MSLRSLEHRANGAIHFSDVGALDESPAGGAAQPQSDEKGKKKSRKKGKNNEVG